MPKPVTITDPFVQLAYDMSNEDISEHTGPSAFHQHPTFTAAGSTVVERSRYAQPSDHLNNRWPADRSLSRGKAILALPTPHPLTEEATMREGLLCKRENITINMFLIPSWSQSEEDIQFAYRLAESTTGRVFFTSGKDLDRFVVWDYVNRRRTIIS